jgi:P27 family predicted phage terminase small subunit
MTHRGVCPSPSSEREPPGPVVTRTVISTTPVQFSFSNEGGNAMKDTNQPPSHLSKEASACWADVESAYRLDPHHRNILTLAYEAWDCSNQAREQIATDGITYVDRFGAPRAHPAVAVMRDSRTAFARLIRELRLDDDSDTEPAEVRPARIPFSQRG